MANSRRRFGRRFRGVLILALVSVAAGGCGNEARKQPPRAERGVIDLRHWDFRKDGPVELNGEWELYWKRFVKPGAQGSAHALLPVPARWNGLPVGDTKIGAQGWGTYRLRVLLPEDAPQLLLRFNDQGSAYQALWSGQPLTQAGTPSHDASGETPLYMVRYASLPPAEPAYGAPVSTSLRARGVEGELLVRISNHFHRLGGLWLPVKLGVQDDMLRSRDVQRLLQAFLAGTIGIIGLYHLIQFLYRRRDRAALWFGIFNLTILVRLLVTGERLLMEGWARPPMTLFLRLEYLSFYAAVPALLGFYHALYPEEFRARAIRWFLFPALAASASVILLPATWYSHTMDPFQVLAIAACLYCLLQLARAAVRQRLGARLILGGTVILASAVLNDIVYNRFIVGLPYVAPVGLFFFIFTQAGALSRRVATAFNTSETLSESLERKVEERTAELAASVTRSDQLAEEARAARLEAELARAESAQLAEVSRRLNETADLGRSADEILGFIKDQYDLKNVALMLEDTQREELYCASAINVDAAAEGGWASMRVPLHPNSGTLYRTYRTQKTLYLPRFSDRGLGPVDRRILEIGRFTSFIQVPLVVQGKTVGILVSNPQRRLGKDEIHAIERFGFQVAGAIREAQLLAETEQARSETAALAELSRRTAEAAGVEAIVDEVQRFSQTRFRVGYVALMVVHQDRELRPRHISDPDRLVSTEASSRALDEVRVPLTPEGGTLFRTYHRQRLFYLPRIDRDWLAKSPFDKLIFELLGFESFVQVPLLSAGRTTGILAYMVPAAVQLGRSDLSLLQAMADQVAGALHGAQQLEEIVRSRANAERERLRAEVARVETETLADLARRANEGGSLDDVMAAVAHVLGDHSGADRLVLYVAERDRSRLTARSYFKEGRAHDPTELPDATRSVPLDERGGSLWRTWRKGRLFAADRRIKELSFQSDADSAVLDLTASAWFVQVPLLVEEQVVGVLAFSGSEERRLRPDEKRFAERVAAQVAGVVRRTELLRQADDARRAAEEAREEADREKRKTEKLNEFSKALNASTDFDTVIEQIVQYLQSEYGIESCNLMLPDTETAELTVARQFTTAVEPELQAFGANLRIPIREDGGIVAKTFQRKKSLYIQVNGTRNIFARPYPGMENDRALITTLRLPWFLLLPLVVQDRSIGMVMASSYTRSDGIAPGEVREISRFAEQIAGAIHSAALLRQIGHERDRTEQARLESERQKRETEELNALVKSVNEDPDLDKILAKVLEYARANFGVEFAAFYDIAPDKRTVRPLVAITPDHLSAAQVEKIRSMKIPIRDTRGGHALAIHAGRPVFTPRIRRGGMNAEELFVVDACGFNSFLLVPLILHGEPIGVLDFSAFGQMSLSKDDITRLSILGEQLAGIIYGSRLFRQIQDEKEKSEAARAESDRLLLNILPARVAEELKREGRVEPLFYDAVSVLFTDFVGFTEASEKMRPDELVAELDGCFSQFDEVVKRNNLEKLKTIGDAYMCAGGLPLLSATHAVDACLAALEFRAFMAQMAEVKQALGMHFWKIRIGIHSGPVTAGVIGTNRFAYDIWGDTVNTASRMESSGEAGRINISGATYDLVRNFFQCEHRGKVKAKGKGELDMYFVSRILPELSADGDGLLPNGRFEMQRMQLADGDLGALSYEAADGASVAVGHVSGDGRDGW